MNSKALAGRKGSSPFFVLLGLFSGLFSSGCKPPQSPPQAQQDHIPTLEEIDSVRSLNPMGEPITEDSVFAQMAKYSIVGFGHNHTQESHYSAFGQMIPQLRQAGFLVLAVELPTSMQPLLDSIMNPNTTDDKVTDLLRELNEHMKTTDAHNVYRADSSKRHPDTEIILDWLNSGGLVVAIDVPWVSNHKTGRTDYFTDMMYKTVREQSESLYQAIKNIDINKLDDDKDLRIISEIRTAYMTCLLRYYVKEGSKVVTFLGADHLLPSVQPTQSVGCSVCQIASKYFDIQALSFYPYPSGNAKGFYKGHPYLGNYGYAYLSK